MSDIDFLNTPIQRAYDMVRYHHLDVLGSEIFLYKLHFPEADPRREPRFREYYELTADMEQPTKEEFDKMFDDIK